VQSIGYWSAELAASPADRPATNGGGAEQQFSRKPVPPLSGAEQAVLQSHMAKVLEQGRVIAPALRAYAEEMPRGRQRRQLLAVCQVLESGEAADTATALRSLPDYWIPLLSAATSSNDPGRALRDFLAESRQTDELRRQRWLSFAYPFLVLCVAVVVLAILSVFIVPVFRDIFDDFDLQLPGLTIFVLTVSQWLARGGIALIALSMVAIGLLLFNAQRAFPWSFSSWLGDRFPAPFGRRDATARFARFTADLLDAGLSVPDALRIAGYSMNRRRLRTAAWQMADDLAEDGGANSAGSQMLSPAVVHALCTPMSAGSRIRLLRELSACDAQRMRMRLSWTTGIIEPVTICVVGIIVGLTVLALFLPLVKLIEGLTQ
jgi:type II secretory pathway component PulF